jgi:hypothetical protein
MKKTLHVFALVCISLLALPAVAQVPAYVPTDGLVGWWPFNGNANDESGNGNDGVVNGATLTEDRFGNAERAFSFDGIDDFIEIQDNESLELLNTDFTINVWIYPQDENGNHIWYKGLSTGNNNNKYLFRWNQSQFAFHINGSGLGTGIWAYSELAETTSWRMGTIVKLGNNISFFIDGLLSSSSTFSNPIPNTTGNNVRIGGSEPNGGGAWFGLLDDIAIYNRALTEQEIQNLYTGTTPLPCVSLPSNLQQGLVGYWPFCGNANDESGNGNDGTVNGATLTEDRFGNANAAYGFDGVDDYINCGNNDALNLNNFSISVWHKLNDLPQSAIDENVLVVKSDYNPGTLGYRIAASSEPQVAEYFIWSRLGGGGQCGGYVNTNQPPISQVWSNIVAIKNQDTISIYRNGDLENTLTGVCGDFSNQRPLLFGCKYDYNEILNGFYDGILDDIGIWNRALTPEEVQELYTLDACTFTVYDTTHVTIYDTLTTYETVYDTLYTYETVYDTVTTYVTVTDTLLIDITFTGFEGQPSWLNTVTVFPNPASDHITIDYGNFALMAGYNTVITEASGATVYSSAVNSQQAYIDINAWGAAGVYYMTIYDASGTAVAVRHIVLE